MHKALLIVGLVILLVACTQPEPTSTPTAAVEDLQATIEALRAEPTPTIVVIATSTPTPTPTPTPIPYLECNREAWAEVPDFLVLAHEYFNGLCAEIDKAQIPKRCPEAATEFDRLNQAYSASLSRDFDLALSYAMEIQAATEFVTPGPALCSPDWIAQHIPATPTPTPTLTPTPLPSWVLEARELENNLRVHVAPGVVVPEALAALEACGSAEHVLDVIAQQVIDRGVLVKDGDYGGYYIMGNTYPHTAVFLEILPQVTERGFGWELYEGTETARDNVHYGEVVDCAVRFSGEAY